ncbi:MAG TPA: hypothetical protein VHV78_06060, partial [Gemmatimonadaceae bacterium]|nr:hypothetical protein [Gemmatimonadaceae bacterium]
MPLTPDPTTYNQQAPTRDGMFDKDGRFTKAWLMWFHQQLMASNLLENIADGVTDGTLASAFDERNPVDIVAAIQDALLQAQSDPTRNVTQEIEDALKRAEPLTPRDFTPDAQPESTPRPEVTRGDLEDVQAQLAYSDLADPRSFTYDGDGNPISSTGGALDVNLKSSSITLPVSGTISISGTVPVTEASLDATIASNGTAVPAKTQQVGGSDGTDIRTFATDTGGRQQVVLYDSSGNPVTSANALPVYVPLSHFPITVTDLALDNTITTPGSAVPVSALQIGGSDGTDLRAVATDASGKLLSRGYALASGDVVVPVQISTKIKASGAFGTSTTAVTLVTAPSGQHYYLTGIKFDVDPSIFFASAILVVVQDSTDGVLAEWVVWPPASAPSAPATPLILTYNSPPGFFYKPSAAATTLSCRVNNALSGAYLYITVNYG